METTKDLLDAVKARYKLPSDYALAAFLGLTRAHVSKYRCDRESLSDEKAMKVAELLGIDAGYVLALMAAERANRTHNEAALSAWSKVAERLKTCGAAAALLLLVAAPALSPTPANAAPAQGSAGGMYIMLNIIFDS
jgi:transcriptional regulator with XRE-family HTH domain